MRCVFLSPHNDDETLFGAFTLLAAKPLVVICLQSKVQELRGEGVTAEQRNLETAQALWVLGCERYHFAPFNDHEPDWSGLEKHLSLLVGPDTIVYAPAVEEGGHVQHNEVGKLAETLGAARIVHYMTYTSAGKSRGLFKAPFEPAWPLLKLQALACYESQITRPLYVDHFLREQYEYFEKA